MRWVYKPDSLGLFNDNRSRCETYTGCDCYCPPKFIKLMIWGPPIPADWP